MPDLLSVLIWVAMVGLCLVIHWLNRRDRRRREVQQQIWDMERAICEEMMPDWQREVIQARREQQVEIRREARRRLGSPEEEA
jgi:hypothetical protein